MIEMCDWKYIDKNHKLDNFQLIVDDQIISIDHYSLEFYYKGSRFDEIFLDKVVLKINNNIVNQQKHNIQIVYKDVFSGTLEQFVNNFVYSVNDFDDLFTV